MGKPTAVRRSFGNEDFLVDASQACELRGGTQLEKAPNEVHVGT